VIINGTGNGGFFSTIPTVVGRVFGSARVSVAMGMMVTGWAGGYLMASEISHDSYYKQADKNRGRQLPDIFLLHTVGNTAR
jgi:hypothetical protein